jgi:hypothetical protein
MTDAIKIVSLTLTESKAWDNGDRLLAHFDCELRGFRLNGCILIRASRGGLLAQAPKGDSQRVGVRAIQIIDHSLRASIADAAHRAYLALGGVE